MFNIAIIIKVSDDASDDLSDTAADIEVVLWGTDHSPVAIVIAAAARIISDVFSAPAAAADGKSGFDDCWVWKDAVIESAASGFEICYRLVSITAYGGGRSRIVVGKMARRIGGSVRR